MTDESRDEEARLIAELIADGRVKPPDRPGGLASVRPLPRRTDLPLLSATLERMREEEDCRCALSSIQDEAIAAADRTGSVVDELITERRSDAASEARWGDDS